MMPPRPAAAVPHRRGPSLQRPDTLRITLFLFIIISISTVQGYVRILGLLRPGLTLWAVALGTVLFVPRSVRWTNVTAAWPAKAIGFIAAIAFVGVFFGLSSGASGSFILSAYIRILILFFILVAAIRSIDDLYLFVWAFVLAAGTLALLSVTVMDVTTGFGGTRIEASSLYDANDLGMIFMTAIPLAVLLVETATGRSRWLAVAVLALIAGATALTGSRGAFIGFAVVVPGLFFAMSHVRFAKRLALGVLLAAGLAVGAPEGYWERIGTIFQIGEDYNMKDAYGRVEIAKRGVGYMLRYPLFGVGVDNFPRAEFTISPLLRTAQPGDAIRTIAPHNTYVQVGAEMGLVALGLWVSILGAATFGLRGLRAAAERRVRTEGATFEVWFLWRCLTYFPIAFIGFASTSYFVSHAYTPPFYILTALLCGVLSLHRVGVRRAKSASPHP